MTAESVISRVFARMEPVRSLLEFIDLSGRVGTAERGQKITIHVDFLFRVAVPT